jgi:hypothetical protein
MRASCRGARSAAPEGVPRQTPPPPPSSAASRGASGSVSRGAGGSAAGPSHASGFGGRIQAASHADASRQARSHTCSHALSSVHLARRLRGLQKQGARRRQTTAAHNTHAAAPRTGRWSDYRDGAIGGRREQHLPVARAAPRPRAVRPARGRRRRARREHHAHDRAGVRLPGAAYRARSQIEHLWGARAKSQLCARSPSARDGKRDQFRGGLGRDRELPRLGTEAQRVATHLQRRDVVEGRRKVPLEAARVGRAEVREPKRDGACQRARLRNPRAGGGRARLGTSSPGRRRRAHPGTWRRRRGGGPRRVPRHFPRAPRAPRSGPRAARQPSRRAQSGDAGAPTRGAKGQSARNQVSLYKTGEG